MIILEHYDDIGDINSNRTKNWIMIIVRNLAYKEHNRKKKERVEDLEEADEYSSQDDEMHIQDEYNLNKIVEAISTLPDKYRDILHMLYTYDLDYKRISEELSVSTAVARKRAERARKMLLDILHERGMEV